MSTRRTYRQLQHRALGLLPFGPDDLAVLGAVAVLTALLKGILVALGALVCVGFLLMAHRQMDHGRVDHLRALLHRFQPGRYARRISDSLSGRAPK